MKTVIWKSRNTKELDLSKYLPTDCDTLIMGGKGGYDSRVLNFAWDNDMKTCIHYPINDTVVIENIISDADLVLIFSNEEIEEIITECEKLEKPYKIIK